MITVLDQERDRLQALCRWYHVCRLEVFGSAADGTFKPASSDLDFPVEFLPVSSGQHYEAYFGLWKDLEALFGRKIDLVEPSGLRNPYFVRRVNESRRLVYAA